MKQETYKLACRIKDRISSLTLMQDTLNDTFVKLTKTTIWMMRRNLRI